MEPHFLETIKRYSSAPGTAFQLNVGVASGNRVTGKFAVGANCTEKVRTALGALLVPVNPAPENASTVTLYFPNRKSVVGVQVAT